MGHSGLWATMGKDKVSIFDRQQGQEFKNKISRQGEKSRPRDVVSSAADRQPALGTASRIEVRSMCVLDVLESTTDGRQWSAGQAPGAEGRGKRRDMGMRLTAGASDDASLMRLKVQVWRDYSVIRTGSRCWPCSALRLMAESTGGQGYMACH